MGRPANSLRTTLNSRCYDTNDRKKRSSVLLYSLKEHHAKQLLRNFYTQQKAGKNTDVTLKTGDNVVKCHSLILAAHSPRVKEKLLQLHTKQTDFNVDPLNLCCLQVFIDYLYGNQIEIDNQQRLILLQIAQKFEMSCLIGDLCKSFEVDKSIKLCLSQNALENVTKLIELCHLDELQDCVLDDGKVQLQVNRTILAAVSEFLTDILDSIPCESQTRVDISKYPGLREVVEVVFSRSIPASVEKIMELLTNALEYKFPIIKDVCEQLILDNVQPSNCLSILNLAKSSELRELQQFVSHYLEAHITEIIKEKEFLELSKDDIMSLLFENESNLIDSEVTVISAITAWYKHDKHRRKVWLTDLLTQVQYQYLPQGFFKHTVMKDRHIFQCISNVLSGERLLNLSPRKYDDVVLLFRKREMVDLYDLRRETWSFVSLLPWKSHTGFLAVEWLGQSLWFCTMSAETWMYTPGVKKSACKVPSPPFGKRVIGLGTAVLDEKVYMVCGLCTGSLQPTFTITFACFDPLTKQWDTDLPPLLEIVGGGTLVTCNDQIFLIGGFDGQRFVQTMQRYDPQSRSWSVAAPLPYEPRGFGTLNAVCCHDNIYVADHLKVLRYEAKTNEWTYLESVSKSLRESYSSIARCGDRLLIFQENNSSVVVYDPVTNEVKKASADLKVPLQASTRVPNKVPIMITVPKWKLYDEIHNLC
ncbi:kelch-like protein 12 [Ptychodera flava]|uniref:kelch-like protein 12 n=1 Tax=Ptychodera flava TaxID=63121 RepID=UPI00396A5D97